MSFSPVWEPSHDPAELWVAAERSSGVAFRKVPRCYPVERLRRATPADTSDTPALQKQRRKARERLAALRDRIAAELDRARASASKEQSGVRHCTQMAEKAVRAGDDSLARIALVRRQEHEKLLSEFQAQTELLAAVVDGMENALEREC